MTESKKQNVSVRMNASDLRKIREIARRMRVRESDVFRFAIKTTLAKLAPLCEGNMKGTDLLPVFMEYGSELTAYFDLDSVMLEKLFNEDVDGEDKKISKDDIDLIVLSAKHESYVVLKLRDLSAENMGDAGAGEMLRRYLAGKYVFGRGVERDEKIAERLHMEDRI